MAADLPLEILSEIFSRLPVRSLLRFRSTSKSLKSLIDSHKFINLHLKNSLNFNFILRHNTDLYQLHFPNLTAAVPLNLPFPRNIDPFTSNINPYRRTSSINLIGSCYGLLAISKGQIGFSHPYGPNEITFLNPNTRKHRIIPFLPLPIPNIIQSDNINRLCLCAHGFGFGPLTGDYKLLRISWLCDQHTSFYDSHVRLFSSKSNSWKIIPTFPYALHYVQTMGVFVENSVHWIMSRKLDVSHPCLTVAFNLTLEIFIEIPLPDEIGGEEVSSDGIKLSVAVLGGCLCMIVNYQTPKKIDVWAMKEYGSRDSWRKLFTLVNLCFDLSLITWLRPLGYSSDGSKVLLEIDCMELVWYDLKSEQVSYVEGIPNLNGEGIYNLNGAMVCVESLVPPSFPVDNRRKKENHTSKSKRREDFLSKGFKLRL